MYILFIGIIIFLIWRVYYWKKQSKEAMSIIAKSLVEEPDVELNLATTEQIIAELAKRPNDPFILLMPKQQRDHFYLDTHSTIAVPMAKVFLKEAYEQLEFNE